MTLDDLTTKISNDGATPQGKLTSEEYNVLLLAVKDHDEKLSAVVTESALGSLLASYVTDAELTQVLKEYSEDFTGNFAAKATTLAGYGITDAYTKVQVDAELAKYVTLATAQSITAVHDFENGLKIGGVKVYKSADGVVYLDGNLVLKGSLTMFGDDGTAAPSLFEALPIDGTTIKWVNGVLTAVGGSGDVTIEGITLEDVQQYLVDNRYATIDAIPTDNSQLGNGAGYITASALNGYATESWVEGKEYLTGITSSMVTTALGYTPLALEGVAVASKKVSSLSVDNVDSTDNFGFTVYQLWAGNEGTAISPNGSVLLNMSTNAGVKKQLLFGHPVETVQNMVIQYRRAVGGTWSAWKTLAFTSDLPTKLSDLTDDVVAGKYLPLSGGTLTDNLTAPTFIGALQGDATNAKKLGGVAATHYVLSNPDLVSGSLNGFTKAGLYRFNLISDAHAEASNYGNLLVVRGGDHDTLSQVYFNYNNNKVFVRSGNSSNIANGVGTWAKLAFVTDNVASATKLKTSRKIWGQSFDGTADVDGDLTLNGGVLSYDSTNGYWTINGDLLVTGGITMFGNTATTLSAISEEIGDHESRIATLEAKVASLEAEIETLKQSA